MIYSLAHSDAFMAGQTLIMPVCESQTVIIPTADASTLQWVDGTQLNISSTPVRWVYEAWHGLNGSEIQRPVPHLATHDPATVLLQPAIVGNNGLQHHPEPCHQACCSERHHQAKHHNTNSKAPKPTQNESTPQIPKNNNYIQSRREGQRKLARKNKKWQLNKTHRNKICKKTNTSKQTLSTAQQPLQDNSTRSSRAPTQLTLQETLSRQHRISTIDEQRKAATKLTQDRPPPPAPQDESSSHGNTTHICDIPPHLSAFQLCILNVRGWFTEFTPRC